MSRRQVLAALALLLAVVGFATGILGVWLENGELGAATVLIGGMALFALSGTRAVR